MIRSAKHLVLGKRLYPHYDGKTQEMAGAAVDIVSGRRYNNNLGESKKPIPTLLRGNMIAGNTFR